MSSPQDDPLTHLNTDPGSEPNSHPDARADALEDPAHDADEDEGWESEGGATPEGPATDT